MIAFDWPSFRVRLGMVSTTTTARYSFTDLSKILYLNTSPPPAFPVASFIFCLQFKWWLTTVFWWGGRLPILFLHFLDHGEEGACSTCFPPQYLPRVERFQREMTSHDLSDLCCWLQTDAETSLLRKAYPYSGFKSYFKCTINSWLYYKS